MSLRISSADLERIYSHGRKAYPEECCGLLIGSPSEGDGTASVTEVLGVDNERRDSRHNRYLISPRVLLDVQRSCRARGLEILGYYHSHPDHPARPSDFDREHAWPATSYVIVSVDGGEVADCRSWRLRDDRSGFDEEEILGADGHRSDASRAL